MLQSDHIYLSRDLEIRRPHGYTENPGYTLNPIISLLAGTSSTDHQGVLSEGATMKLVFSLFPCTEGLRGGFRCNQIICKPGVVQYEIVFFSCVLFMVTCCLSLSRVQLVIVTFRFQAENKALFFHKCSHGSVGNTDQSKRQEAAQGAAAAVQALYTSRAPEHLVLLLRSLAALSKKFTRTVSIMKSSRQPRKHYVQVRSRKATITI